MALTTQLALVPDGVTVDPSNLTRVASALSKQVLRDFQPIWGIDATVDAFVRLEDVPTDYWPIIITANVPGAAGYHEDKNGQPFALVKFQPGDAWSITASHECLEMLADPFGRRLRAADVLDQAVDLGRPRGRVRYLVEVCDPSEAFSYSVNGVQVSDFYTPEYFDPVPAPNVRYSFTGDIKAPRTVLPGGYISWEDTTTGEWWQLQYFDSTPKLVNLSSSTTFDQLRATHSLRAAIEMVTAQVQADAAARLSAVRFTAARAGQMLNQDNRSKFNEEARKWRAATLRAELRTLGVRAEKSAKPKAAKKPKPKPRKKPAPPPT